MSDPEATRIRPLFTAAEAYPELERLFLSARRRIDASFRIFDLRTRLRTPQAQKVGRDWFDLLVATLGRGVEVHFVLSDFDPILGTHLHHGSWRSARSFWAAAEMAGGALHFDLAMHPASAGGLVRLAFQPLLMRRLRKAARQLNALPPEQRTRRLAHNPGLAASLQETASGALRPRYLSLPRISPATHHQKLAVFDEETLFIGGLDLDERRYDTPEHDRAADQTWQDISAVVTGPPVAAAVEHLRGFHARPTTPSPIDGHDSFVVTRSMPWRWNPMALSPRRGTMTIKARTLGMIAAARGLIYLETQFLRSREVTRALVKAARNKDLSLIIMLPAAPEDVAFEGSGGMDARFGEFLQARSVAAIRRAFGPRVFIGMPARPVRHRGNGRDTAAGAPIVYIHSKLTIADDHAMISSANLNGRSMNWDTEAGLVLEDAEAVSALRRRAFASWLPDDAEEAFFRDRTAVRAWANLAAANLAAHPSDRRGFLLPYDVRPALRFGRDVPAIPEETV